MEKPQYRKFRQETVIQSFILRPLSVFIVRMIWNWPITPNQISVFRIFLNIAALVLFATGNKDFYILGTILFIVHEVLDHVDGTLARHKGLLSGMGAFLETAGDVLFSSGSTLLGLAIAYGAYQATGSHLPILFFASITAISECASTFYRINPQLAQASEHLNHDTEVYLDIFVMNPKIFIKNFVRTLHKFANYILIFAGLLMHYSSNMLTAILIGFVLFGSLEALRLGKNLILLFKSLVLK